MVLKMTILLLMLLSFGSLGHAAYCMLKDQEGTKRMAKALTWRLGFSVATVALLMVAYAFGWITPHPLVLG